MAIVLGIESTAHTFGVGIVKNGKVIANKNKTYTTETGGIIPVESAKHHCENKNEIYFEALDKAGVSEKDIDAIAFSQSPGLAPCLLEGMKFAKELAGKLKIPIVPVNHCIAHLEIGRLTGAKNPVMLYVSGANTQIISYENNKYRIFGETLDIGIGNFIDTFARYSGIGFPGGPAIEKLALQGKNYIELPYKVKGMDIALSGILTNLKQKIEKISKSIPDHQPPTTQPLTVNAKTFNKKYFTDDDLISNSSDKIIGLSDTEISCKPPPLTVNDKNLLIDKKNNRAEGEVNYSLPDLCYSMQETVFAMLVECAERALAHTGKKELLLGGGVACNSRLQEMCRIMCKERGAKLFVPEKSLLVDNGGMIAFLGEIMFRKKIFEKNLNKIDIKPRQRTDDIIVKWK